MFRAIIRASVWGRDGIRPEDWRYRGISRWVLPVTDLLFIWFGIAGYVYGIQSVQEATYEAWQTGWSMAIAISAFVALVGVSWPKLWLVELLGKIPMIGLVFTYLIVMIVNSAHNPYVAATAGLLCVLVLLPIWRVGDLGFVSWKRSEEAHPERSEASK